LAAEQRPGYSGEAEAIDFAVGMLSAGHGYVDTFNNCSNGSPKAALGIAVSELGGRRSTEVIAKVDVDPVAGRFDRDRVMRSFDESLARFRIDHVPVLHPHDRDMVSIADALGPRGYRGDGRAVRLWSCRRD
jgi:D-threo-aldose 1-dehydrogenase